ncbi:MAG: hypothetical protein R2795_10275 [Saprospiraceae bacterium]
MDAYEILWKVSKAKGNWKNATEYAAAYIDLLLLLERGDRNKEIIGVQAAMDVKLASEKYERQLREQELAQARLRTLLLTVALGAISLLALLLFFSYRKVRRVNKELDQTNTALEASNIGLAKAKQQIQMASNKLQQFAFATGHDLKESLRNINSFTQLASIALHDDPSTAQQHLQEATSGSKRMRKMLEDLLHYSNISGNSAVVTSFPVQDALSSVKQQLKNDIVTSMADVHLLTSAVVKADREEIEQLFYNLVHNAAIRSPR